MDRIRITKTINSTPSLQYMEGDSAGTLKIQEPVGRHVTATANIEMNICETEAVTVTPIDTVRSPALSLSPTLSSSSSFSRKPLAHSSEPCA